MLTSMVDAQRKTYKEFDALIDKRLSELDATMPSISVFDIDGTVFLSTTSRLVPTINLHVIGMCNKLRRAPHNYILFLTARKQSLSSNYSEDAPRERYTRAARLR